MVAVSPGILVPLIVVPLAAIILYAIYRRTVKNLEPDDAPRQISGARLTGERLRTLPTPPWRVVHEIGDSVLDGVDHIAVGPPGVIAIGTVMADRPARDLSGDAQLTAAAAVARGGVDELSRRVGIPCDLLAKVYWGTPQPEQPAAHELVHGAVAVEGQRLEEWLHSLPAGPLTPVQIDLAWQAVVTGIGRPDPLP